MIYAGVKLLENRDPLIKNREKLKTGMGNSTGNKAKALEHVGLKGKCNKRTNNNTTWWNEQESTGERTEIKKISTKGNTIKTKQGIPKQRNKNSTKNWGRRHKKLPTTGPRKTELCSTKILQPSRMD